ncbi:hypothetical protein GCM10011490_15440 [Pseudoclavibacter endophyticus]|uniref:Phosphoribosylformylglycinamidine synthase subunit PurS n=1 Tax=Pseudoclavibacter endophyticus TaxID=1778590 RepID=A0A6H9WMT7_9MICO|nr:phosphoribosylformylglycinamidine synthase subunit PurS [Pseudoclavibacter endophyticus]KAB1649071.1 phosphoribosylformylglycinamidine synthase subunit PurS [Pseudoclavibacter endophyticus]GGA65691.1 hypothetical protein GCM10011490_15440 [Pseudoclavibacter endophyticus]
MPKIVVQVMPKEELLDPQGKAVAGALARLGKGYLSDVRVGKRFEITTDREPSGELMAEITAVSEELLSNGVIEDVISIDVIDDEFDGELDEEDDDERNIPLDEPRSDVDDEQRLSSQQAESNEQGE